MKTYVSHPGLKTRPNWNKAEAFAGSGKLSDLEIHYSPCESRVKETKLGQSSINIAMETEWGCVCKGSNQ